MRPTLKVLLPILGAVPSAAMRDEPRDDSPAED